MAKDLYAILGVKPSATNEEIKKQYRQLSKLYHPDVKKGSEDKFAEISEAYSILGDPTKRKAYVEELQKAQNLKKQASETKVKAEKAGFSGAAADAYSVYAQRQQQQQQQFADAITNAKKQGYNEGYKKATEEAQKVIDQQTETYNKTIKMYDQRLSESEKYRSTERGEVQTQVATLLAKLRNEENIRIRREAEFDKLKRDFTALQEELELANEAIDGFLQKGDGVKKTTRTATPKEEEVKHKTEPEIDYNYIQDEAKSDEDFWKDFEKMEAKANSGDGAAQNAMGEYYFYGTGVEQDYKQAVEWFKKAANNHNADGLLNYGTCFYNGEGVAEDPIMGEQLIRMSAKNGNKVAQQFCDEQKWDY